MPISVFPKQGGGGVEVPSYTGQMGTLYTDGNGISWTIDPRLRKVISQDTTITVRASGGNFTDIQTALNSLLPYEIQDGVTVTIEIDSGIWNISTGLTFNYRFAKNVVIKGRYSYAKTISGATATGSAGNWSIVYTLADVDNIAVGDYILVTLPDISGTNKYTALGYQIVTAVDTGAKKVTVTNSNVGSSSPSGITGTLTVVKTVINATVGAIDLFKVEGYPCTIRDLMFINYNITDTKGLYFVNCGLVNLINVGVKKGKYSIVYTKSAHIKSTNVHAMDGLYLYWGDTGAKFESLNGSCSATTGSAGSTVNNKAMFMYGANFNNSAATQYSPAANTVGNGGALNAYSSITEF